MNTGFEELPYATYVHSPIKTYQAITNFNFGDKYVIST